MPKRTIATNDAPVAAAVATPELDTELRARPFLKWAGSKRASVTTISVILPAQMRRYYEPMVGGGALFFWLAAQPGRFQSAVISDVNRELINCYQVIREQLDTLIDRLRACPYDKAFYAQTRAMNPVTMPRLERAVRFIYLNKSCFNGLYRVNRDGQFNVPFGRYTNPTICDAENLRRVYRLLSGPERVRILNEDYVAAIATAEPGDAVYFDPPYVPVSKTANFTAYGPDAFGPDEQRRLANVFRGLANRGIAVALSNSAAPLVYDLYQGFRMRPVEVRRSINSKASKRGAVTEVLITANCIGD